MKPLCYGKWLAHGDFICEAHGHLWPDGEKFCNAIEKDVRDALEMAWDEGFKQGGPMHDSDYNDPDAHTRNPYKE